MIIENIQIWKLSTIVPIEMLSYKIKSYYLFFKNDFACEKHSITSPFKKKNKTCGMLTGGINPNPWRYKLQDRTCEVRRSRNQKKKMRTRSKTIKRLKSLKASTKLCLQVKVKEKKGSEKSDSVGRPHLERKKSELKWKDVFEEKSSKNWPFNIDLLIYWLTVTLSLPFLPLNQSKVRIIANT